MFETLGFWCKSTAVGIGKKWVDEKTLAGEAQVPQDFIPLKACTLS